ncbi:MAG: zinc metallopeptidase [Clostridia bacterium]|nr:zinc metallopeptidase [Clostridia bacterium]
MPFYIIFLISLAFTLYAQIKVKSTFAKYSKVTTTAAITGRGAALLVLGSGNLNGIMVVPTGGELTDNYNPKTMIISLSKPVYGSDSVAASGVAAHEAGHALQHAEGFFPLLIRNTLVPVCSFMSKLTTPLILIGLLVSYVAPYAGGLFIEIAAASFAFAVLFQLVTLPVEFNASGRAIKVLRESGRYTEEELAGARKVLSAAALTYVAAMAASVVQFFRLILLVQNRRR